ncbi:helix-turn-helix domain-containing protein [Arthrobacter sp. ZGTC131]|uniref:helix-turn-helix domain-containing protein n=1 Tax=Arthrobacter sp. ZGTC131 TaxID=2058898 RepID=UPI000CE53537
MAGDLLITAAELATRLNVSVETVHRMCRSHRWPHCRIGRLYRFTEEHYQAIIATPEPPEPWTKERRDNIGRMLRKSSERQ